MESSWSLKGIYYECCRTEGQCPIWFGRDMWKEPCVNLRTYETKKGQIEGVEMAGIIIIQHQDGIGPKYADIERGKGIKEGAVYISDNASHQQRKILEPFVTNHLGAERWGLYLGIKFVEIKISESNGTYHVVMPFGEQKLSLTIGGDGRSPIRIENPKDRTRSNIKVCNTDLWRYNDYRKNLEFRNTSGAVADFAIQGT